VPKIEIINKKDSQLAEKNGLILTLIGVDDLKFYDAYKILIFSLHLPLLLWPKSLKSRGY
jgi:hypothetical protein